MDCRTAHTLMMSELDLEADEHRAYQTHITQCAACRDDHHDPLSRALVQTTRELALPPPDFTAKLLQRLPGESPLELAQQAVRRQRRRTILGGAGVVGLAGLAIVVGNLAQPLWAETTLGLVAQVVNAVSLAALVPLVVMLTSALVIALLLPIITRHPTPSRALGAAAIAAVLVLSAGTVTAINDQENVRDAAANASVATVFRSLEIKQPLNGAVASLTGDIAVVSNVRGNVASLVGDVSLAPSSQIRGNVLAGRLQAAPNQVAGVIHHNFGALAVSDALRTSGTASLSPSLVRGLGALLGALVMLALAGLVVMLWPNRTLRTSRRLPHQPWAALGLGVMITALLLLLALPVLALLAATVVGLLLAPMLLIAIHLPYVQGLAAVGQALGQRLTGAATLTGALWGVAVQLVLVLGLGIFAPFAGLAAFYLLASIGIGAQVLERRSLI